MYELASHATTRAQQRCISEMQMELIRMFGEDHYQKGGSHLAYVSDKQLKLLRKAIDQLASVQLIKGKDERVVTAMHRTRRTHTTAYAA